MFASTSTADPNALHAANNLSEVNAATARTNLGLGTAATHNTGDFLQPSNNLSDVGNQKISQVNLGLPIKAPVRCVFLTNTPITGNHGTDGVTPVAGDRVICVAQTTPSQNGPWITSATFGVAWTRPDDYNATNGGAFEGALIAVSEGTNGAGTIWQLQTSGAITVDTTSTTWKQVAYPRADVEIYRTDGQILPFYAASNSATLRAGAHNAAAAVAQAGDIIQWGPGNFDFGSSTHCEIPAGVKVRGLGASITTATSELPSNGDSGQCCFTMRNGSVLEDVGISAALTTGVYQLLVGSNNSDTNISAEFRRVAFSGQSDNFYYGSGSGSQFKFYDCSFTSTYDTVALLNGAPKCFFDRCTFNSSGMFPGTPAGGAGIYQNNCCNIKSGSCEFRNSKFAATGFNNGTGHQSSQTLAVWAYSSGSATLIDCTSVVTAPIGIVADVYNNGSSGNVTIIGGAGSNAGGAWATTSASGGAIAAGCSTVGHLQTLSAKPSISAGAGLGSGATVSVAGTDTAGVVTVTTGASPPSDTVYALFTISFASAYPNAPAVIVSAATSAAAALSAITEYETISTTGFVVSYDPTISEFPLSPSTTYTWLYHVIGI